MNVAPVRFANLQSMMDLFRSLINDDGGGQDGPQDGLIATNDAPFTVPFLRSACNWVYRELRNVGDPALILDNYLVLGLPALLARNAAVQVALGFQGYFDGYQSHGQWRLPAELIAIDKVWERVAGDELNFVPMANRPDGLPPRQQLWRMGEYEWRQNKLVMPGALNSVDLRIRCKVTLPPILDTQNLDFATTYVPLIDAEDAIVDRMLVLYARRFDPERLAEAKQESKESMFQLQRAISRTRQRQQNARSDFGLDATGGFEQFGDL